MLPLARREHIFPSAALNDDRSTPQVFAAKSDERFTRRGRDAANLRNHVRGASAAECARVPWHERRVGENNVDCGERRAQFLGDGLRERRANILTDFRFAAEQRDRAVGGDVQPRGEFSRPPISTAAPPRRRRPTPPVRVPPSDRAARERRVRR